MSRSNDLEERDEMEFCCNVRQGEERSKASRETEKGEKKNTLVREEKQPDGMTVNPFSSIRTKKKMKKGECDE